jgi:hypothetical protein
MKHYVSKACDVDGLVYIEDVSVSFEVETETFPAEPYSWGGSRGEETEITGVDITGVQVGGLVLTEDQASKMFGSEAIERIRDGLTLEDLTD